MFFLEKRTTKKCRIIFTKKCRIIFTKKRIRNIFIKKELEILY